MAEETKKTRTRKSAAAQAEKKEAELITEAPAEAALNTENPAQEKDPVAELKAQYEAQIAAMKEEMAKQMASFKEALAEAQKPQFIQVAADVEKVQFLYMAEVCDENVYEVGPNGMYGRIVGKTGTFYVPKSDLSRVMDTMFRLLMKKRWIVVVSGMTDEERAAYGVDYRLDEVLKESDFSRIIELGNGILGIYPSLCDGHREVVEKRYFDAWRSKNPLVNRDTVAELNRLAKNAGRDKNAFRTILEEMNAEQV